MTFVQAGSELWTADGPEPLWHGSVEPLNIYYLDHNPELAAQYHCDRHVSKGVTETAQILSTVWHLKAPKYIGELFTEPPYSEKMELAHGEMPSFVRTLGGQRIYRPTFRTHPTVRWAGESRANYDWLWRLGMFLADEYRLRWERRHGNASVLWTLERAPPELGELARSEPPALVPSEARYVLDGDVYAVPSYRQFYAQDKQGILGWRRRRPPPAWIERDGAGWRVVDLGAE